MDPQTICPKDLVVIKEDRPTHQALSHSVPGDLSSEDLHMAIEDNLPLPGEQTGTTFEEPWHELFDDLFAHSGK